MRCGALGEVLRLPRGRSPRGDANRHPAKRGDVPTDVGGPPVERPSSPNAPEDCVLAVAGWGGTVTGSGPLRWARSDRDGSPGQDDGRRRYCRRSPLRPLAPAGLTAVPCCHRSTPPRCRPSDKWQTRREAGTQSHGPLAGSRVAEQEVDRGGPEIPGSTARRTIGHHPRCGGRGAARRSIQLPPLRISGRRVTHCPAAASYPPTGAFRASKPSRRA